jgi:hypothetical protein
MGALKDIAEVWMVVRPIKRWREHRQAKREARMAETVTLTLPSGETIEHTPPVIAARTSTKTAAGSALLAFPGYEIVQQIQAADLSGISPWLENFTNGPAFVWLCATIIPVVIARFTKSPLNKQAL